MRSVLALAPHPDPARRLNSETRDVNFFAQRLKVVTIRERSVQFNPKISGNWTEWQGLTAIQNVELTLGLSVMEVKGCRHRFGV